MPFSPPDAPADRAAVSEDVAGLLARMDKMADDDSGLLDGEVRTIREAVTALRAVTDRAEKAEAFANRWMHAAMYAVGAADLTLAFDPTAPESFAESRRRAIDALMAKAEATESRHATAIERVKQLPRRKVLNLAVNGTEKNQTIGTMGYVDAVEYEPVLSILTGEPHPAPETTTRKARVLCGNCGNWYNSPEQDGRHGTGICGQKPTPSTTEN